MSTEERAAAAFGAWRERVDRGESVDPEDVIRAHPEVAAALRRQFDALRLVARAFEGAGPPAADAQGAWLAGRTLGRWRLVSVLGGGGMGTVFLAQDGEQRAAVKVLHPHLMARRGFVERFRREAQIGTRVRHANVVATLDVGSAEVDGRVVHYLVMEHVEGRTLRALLDELGRVPEALCRHVGRETARALAAIHGAGAVHRDLKPDNVIVTLEHAVKLMDLGVARLRDEAVRLSQVGAFVGSVQYGSPEQFRDPETVDARADLHGLGLVLYELATGVHPFHADGFHGVVRRVLDETPRPAAEFNPQLSPFFEDLLARLLEKDRARRPASAEEVARILDDGEESAWWRERAKAIRAETRRPLRRIRIPRETSLYGRDAELARLRALFDAAKAGDGRVVLLEGEAGIGKSRLVDELVGRLAQEGEDVNFLYGSYPPGGAATASGAFSAAFREHLGDDESSVRAALPETPLLVPAFASLLRGDAAPVRAEPLTKDSLHAVFVQATRSLAAKRTTIVLVDDLHFAPEEGRALFAALAWAVPGHRVLLVGAARPTLDEAWVRQIERLGHATRFALPRLSPKDLVRLLADSLRSTHLAEELAGKIATKSDGNPFFVFEILRGLREGRFLARKPDGTWVTTKVIAEIDVPSSVVDLVQERVSGLGRDDRDVLEVAACIGFSFDPALVGDVLGIARVPVLQALGAVEKSHRLVRSTGRQFVFDHHQVMEVLYAGLSEPLREAYHAGIATALEERSGAASKDPKDVDGALSVDLAEHLLAGAQGARALRYLDAALTHLERTYRHGVAVRLIDRALDVPGLLEGGERARILLRKAMRLDLLARRESGRAAIDEALSLAVAANDAALKSRALRELGLHLLMVSRPAEAEPVLRSAAELARESGDWRSEGNTNRDLGYAMWWLHRYEEAKAFHERCLALAREFGDRTTEAHALGNIGLVLRGLGRWPEAHEHFVQHLAISRETGDRQCQATAAGNLGGDALSRNRFEEAREHLERHLLLCREVGNRHGEAVATGNLGNCAFGLGRLAEARERYERYLAVARETGNRMGEAIALVNAGALCRICGRLDEARDWLTRGVSIAREIGARYPEGYGLQDLAALSDEEGDPARAEIEYTATLALRRQIAHKDGVADTLLARGALRVRQGRKAEARADLDEALAIAREMSLEGVELVAKAWRTALEEGAVAAAVAALSAHEERAFPQAAMQVRLLLWEATGDRTHVEEARRRLDRLVAHAPQEYRESMLTNVRLHRAIAAAADSAGVPAESEPS